MSRRILAAIAFAGLLASCATTYTLVPAQARVALPNGLSVEPGRAWSAVREAADPNVVQWTMDGPLLDEIGFVGGLDPGDSIFRARVPIPVFRIGMDTREIETLFRESLARAKGGEDLVTTSNLRAATFAGKPGFRFDFTLVRREDGIERRGIAAGASYQGRLYLVFFHATRLHYFPANVEEAERIIASARLG